VIVMMMYTRCATFCPMATQRMVELHHQSLAGRMGKDLSLVSISLKPEEDDPAALKAYARTHRAVLPGWTFLTGSRYDVDTLRYRLFSHDHIGIDLEEELHAGSIKIINDSIGRWVHADAFASTRTLLDHVEWTDPPKSLAQRRRENRNLQQRIEQEISLYGYRKIV
jgi:protein SCO1/2